MKKLFVILFLIPGLLLSQNSVVDSLKQELTKAKHDTTKCAILSAMIDAENDNNLWPSYNEQLRKLAEKNIAANKKYKTIYLKYLATAFSNKGFLERQHGEIGSALNYYMKGLSIQQKTKEQEGMSISLHNIALIFEMQGDIKKALEYNHKSLKIKERIGDKTGIANSLNNIGFLYRNQGDFTHALECYTKSLKIQEQIGDKRGTANSLNNIGAIYEAKGDTEKSLAYFQKSLKIHEEIGDEKGIATGLCNVGSIYQTQGNITKSLEYYNKGLEIQQRNGDKKGTGFTYDNIANALLIKGDLNDALAYAIKSMQIAKELGFPKDIENAAHTSKLIYGEQKKFKQAFEMFELEIKMRDSINNEETQKEAVRKQLKYEFEKRATADSVQHAEEQKITDAKLEVQKANLKSEKIFRYALYSGLVLVIGFLIFVFNRFRVIKKQKIIIEEQKVQVDHAFEELHERNKEVMDSIRYARRIQTALLPSQKYIHKNLKERG